MDGFSPQPTQRGAIKTVSLASQIICAASKRMHFDKHLTGRTEKRLPIMVVVRLSALTTETGEVEEKTYTDNVSSQGVRVCSNHRWQPGDQLEVAPIDQGPPMQGEVVYCEKFDKARFFVGLRFHRGKAPWRVLQRYDNH